MKKILWRLKGWHKPPYIIQYELDNKQYGLFCFTRKEEKAICKYIKIIGGHIHASLCTTHSIWTADKENPLITTIPHYELYDKIRKFK